MGTLKLFPMINLESICHLNCQWKILVFLSRVPRTGCLGGVGDILTKITKNWLKMAKAVFFDRCSTNTIAFPITTAKLLSLLQKTWRGYFLNLKEKDIRDNFGALWNRYHLTRKNPLRNLVGWGSKIISEDETRFEQIFLYGS